jgi:flagella basal body P-ring formation protein FlgA
VFYNEILLQRNLSKFVFNLNELNGFIASRYIPAGGPVMRNMIKKKIIVTNGEQVELLYRRGTVLMYSEGLALENGGVGDVISVKAKFSDKKLKGIIMGGNRIEILN